MLSVIVVILLDGPRVGSLDSMAYFIVMNRPVASVSKIPMDARAWSLKPSRYGVYFVLKVCGVETGSLNCTLWHLMYSLGLVWTGGGGGSFIWWLDCINVVILCIISS